MLAVLLRVLALTGVYLLVLTSLRPGDVLIGLALATALEIVRGVLVRGRARRSAPATTPAAAAGRSPASRAAGVPALVFGTLVDMIRGSVTVAAYCLGRRCGTPGLVTVPLGPITPVSAAAWGIRVGIAPDSVVVDLDEHRGEMVLHVLDAAEPDAVVAAQHDSYRRRQRRVFG